MNPPNGNYDTNWTAFPHTFHLFPIMALKHSKHLENSLRVGVMATGGKQLGATSMPCKLKYRKIPAKFVTLIIWREREEGGRMRGRGGDHVKFVPSLSQHPSCAHLVPCVITAGERLSRCESESWETPAGPRMTGAFSASEASVQHLWTERQPHLLPNISCLCFFLRRLSLSLSLLKPYFPPAPLI